MWLTSLGSKGSWTRWCLHHPRPLYLSLVMVWAHAWPWACWYKHAACRGGWDCMAGPSVVGSFTGLGMTSTLRYSKTEQHLQLALVEKEAQVPEVKDRDFKIEDQVLVCLQASWFMTSQTKPNTLRVECCLKRTWWKTTSILKNNLVIRIFTWMVLELKVIYSPLAADHLKNPCGASDPTDKWGPRVKLCGKLHSVFYFLVCVMLEKSLGLHCVGLHYTVQNTSFCYKAAQYVPTQGATAYPQPILYYADYYHIASGAQWILGEVRTQTVHPLGSCVAQVGH